MAFPAVAAWETAIPNTLGIVSVSHHAGYFERDQELAMLNEIPEAVIQAMRQSG